ncbi:MAG: hypothetical protein IJU55_00885 [Selenomonadaceae bacterium]|nr:hypothetical protein [Selenomonadaceae bacterium]
MKTFEKISWQVILILFAGFFLVMNLITPFIADDISYAFIWDGEHKGNLLDDIGPRERINSFTDILISQYSHYFWWGGRTVAHIIVQFFSWVGKSYFDVLNVLIFCAFVFLIFKIATGLTLREMNKKFLLFIILAIYFLSPSWVLTSVWMTGSINYMWMVTLELLFILPFAIKYRDKNFNPPKFFVIVMAVLGLLAGWSIEPGASVTLFVTFFAIIKFWREKNLQSWMTVGFLFLFIGFLFLVLAPGNIAREELMKLYDPDPIISYDLLYTPTMFYVNIIYTLLPVIVRESPLFLPIIFYFAGYKKNSDATKFILNFLAASFAIMFVMIFLPFFPQRATFPANIFLLISSLAAFKEILPELTKIVNRRKNIFMNAGKVFAVFCVLHMSACLYVDFVMYFQLEDRWKIIEENKNADEIVVPYLKIPSWSEDIVGQRSWTQVIVDWGADLEPYFEGNRNIMFAQYYGLKKIRAEESPTWRKITYE